MGEMETRGGRKWRKGKNEMERGGGGIRRLHRRIARALLALLGDRPRPLIAGFGLARRGGRHANLCLSVRLPACLRTSLLPPSGHSSPHPQPIPNRFFKTDPRAP